MNAEDAAGLMMVMLGYGRPDGDGGRVLTFTAQFRSTEGAVEALKAIGGYNNFDGEKVAEAVPRIAAAAKGGLPPSFAVGRELSPCVYVSQLGGDEEVKAVEAIFRELHADEVDEVGTGAGTSFGRSVRAWWD